ncbi:sigma 54-interacting transcriptional regulator [Pseudogracilibacillus sp. SO30301A]|uniref:sigma 54-interacting transcriptional regulator n=1 Tax=Pseudogracilibacillus sp. SO30301A TaxID=3098291 RepID=UPI00300E0641
MLNVSREKIHPLFSISIDPLEKNWEEKITQSKDPFVFLERNGELYAYVFIGNMKEDITLDMITSNASSLDMVGVLKDEESVSAPFLFQTLGDPIALVKNNEEYIGYIRREDLLIELLREEDNHTNLLKIMLASIPMGIFIVNTERKIINCNEAGIRMIKSTYDDVMFIDAEKIFDPEKIEKTFATSKAMLNQIHVTDDLGVLFDYNPIVDANGQLEGLMIIVQDLPKVEEMAMEIQYVKDLNADLNAILTSMYDELLVVDQEGIILRYSDNFISDFAGTNVKELIGKSIFDLESNSDIGASVADLVIKREKKASIVQERNGKNVMAIGNPVFNEKGELYRVVIATRDITETTKLKNELDATKRLTKEYEKQIENLKRKEKFGKKIIYSSLKMERIMMKIEKLAEFHSTVMILGESGVGKDLIAEVIHQHGKRADKPFLALNCGAIPEELLESELFGYVKGAFTGADNEGKVGYFEQAHQGVLFLDEISELPQRLQVKLLRVLQEKEITRVGSTQTIPIDVQIITATNKDLKELVKTGQFREDLFYRINVIPITIPPLRERSEDIPLLAYHFIERLNEQYEKNYHLSPEALSLLEAYAWPGNVRELQNLMERLVVFADEDVITADFISPFMHFGQARQSKPVITEVLPLHEAKEWIEEQLITLAMEKYKTTTEAAKALQINQSTVSRKYKRIMEKKEILEVT